MSDEKPNMLPLIKCPECGVMVLDEDIHKDWRERVKQAISLSNIGLGGMGL